MALFSRRDPRPRGSRVLVASAQPVILGDREQAQQIRHLRQAWQQDAWTFRDALPELGYAVRFSRNCASRIKLTAGYYDDPEATTPTPLADSTAPAQVKAQVQILLDDLRGGAGGDAKILAPLIENLKVPGEAYLLGRADPDTALVSFSIRSTDELPADAEGRWYLRDSPIPSSSGQLGELLDPETTFVARLWQQHPRFSAWADSPMRQLIDVSEELLLASRQVRAALRSRLAGSGILAVAEELDLPPQPQDGEDEDPEASPLMAALTEAMLTPIGDPGHPSAVIPILIRGPAELIDKGLKYLTFTQLLDPKILDMIEKAIGRLATGLDLPREVITGMADISHWGAWAVSDDTFRNHIEPDVQVMVDQLTIGYLRPALRAVGMSSDVVRRCAIWYDATELLTHPDRSKDALDAWDRHAISNDALRDAMGWQETDQPTKEELLLRLLSSQRSWAPNVVEAIVHQFFPQLVIPSGGPTAPGSGSSTVPAIEPPAQTVDRQPGPPQTGGDQGPPAAPSPAPPASAALTAAAKPKPARRLSQRLTSIDRQLRDRLAAAAHTTLLRVLDRAGNRARSKATRAVQASLAGMSGRAVLARLGRDTITASYGLDEASLLDDEMSDLQQAWDDWVSTGQEQALVTACAIAGLSVDDPRLEQVRTRLAADRVAGWTVLAERLRQQAADAMWEPPAGEGQPPATPSAPTSLVRAALAVAGGMSVAALSGVTSDGGISGYVGGVGTGATISDVLTTAGAGVEEIEWVYGVSEKSFEPHVALDGLIFTAWDDPALANTEDFPDADFYTPGDHAGCSCDALLTWVPPFEETADEPIAASASPNGKVTR